MSNWNAEIFVKNLHHNCYHATDIYDNFTVLLDDRIKLLWYRSYMSIILVPDFEKRFCCNGL